MTCDSGYILSDINSTNIHSAPPVKKYNNDRNRASPLNTKKKNQEKEQKKKKKMAFFFIPHFQNLSLLKFDFEQVY